MLTIPGAAPRRPKLSHDRVTHAFTGDIEGEGTWQGLNAYRDEATAVYVGFERVAGRVGHRSGSLVIQVSGTYENSEARTAWSVVSGTRNRGAARYSRRGRLRGRRLS